jgi:ribose transport system permease protein
MSAADQPLTSYRLAVGRSLSVLSGPLIGLVGVLSIFIVLIGLKGELRPFLSWENRQVVAHEMTIPAIVALGAVLVIISGGIDLSVGSVVALVTVVTMQVYTALYRGPETAAQASLVAVPAGMLVGGLCGLANGLIITQLRVTPFVATLGMLGIARGLAVWLAGRKLLAFPGPTPRWVQVLANANGGVLVFSPGFWSVVVLAVAVAVLLHLMVLGRYTYAIGSNEATARLCGVPINRSKVMIYTLAGLLTGWAGIVHFAHGGSGDPSAGVGLELDVIAAVVIGGASLTGGRGTVLGTLLGVLILQVLANGVSTFNVPIEAQYVLMGLIIIVNTALSAWQQRRGEGAAA